MRTIVLFFLLISLSLSMDAYGQKRRSPDYSVKNKKAIRFYEEAENYYVRRQFEQAAQLLQRAIQKAPDFREAHVRLAAIYREVGAYERALVHLEAARDAAGKGQAPPESLFALGELSWQMGNYEQAEAYMQEFLSRNPRQQKLVNEAGRIAENARFAREQLQNPLPFKPEPLPEVVNAYELQYFPVLTVDQQNLIFTQRVSSHPQHEENLMISRRDAQGNWQAPESISPNINTQDNEGTSTISADGRTLIFTSCKGRQGYGSCDLYISQKTGDTWSEPENLGSAINSRNWESQPSLSADGRTLYFVSNRPGGVGGNDIYMSRLTQEAGWSRPENLGSPVNTPRDEISPFMHANGQTLYFASNGHKRMGGYDLFMTEVHDEEWLEPRNMGFPINNHEDQVSLYVTPDGRQGYYSDEEMQGGRVKRSMLYRFDIPEPVRVRHRSNYITGRVFDAETREPIEADITLLDINEDEMVENVSSDPEHGTYYIVLTEGSEYGLYVNKRGYIFQSLSFNYQEDDMLEPIELDVYLEPVRSGAATILNNIFFESGQHRIQPKSEPELIRVAEFMKENPEIKIEIAGHTDNVGDAAYNQQLSEKRAQAVHDYLEAAGVAPDRMRARGYGQDKPLAPNNSEGNRQRNRRIEFSIL
jgi:OOP family OmpA-OmpF porin